MSQTQKMVKDLNGILQRNFRALNHDAANSPEMRIARMIYYSMVEAGMGTLLSAEVASGIKITITQSVWDDARAEVEELVGTMCEGVKLIFRALEAEYPPEVVRVFMLNYVKEMYIKLET